MHLEGVWGILAVMTRSRFWGWSVDIECGFLPPTWSKTFTTLIAFLQIGQLFAFWIHAFRHSLCSVWLHSSITATAELLSSVEGEMGADTEVVGSAVEQPGCAEILGGMVLRSASSDAEGLPVDGLAGPLSRFSKQMMHCCSAFSVILVVVNVWAS